VRYEVRYTADGDEVRQPICCARCGDSGIVGKGTADKLQMWTAWPCRCDAAAKGRQAIAGFPRYLDGKTLTTFDWSGHEAKRRAIYEYVKALGDNLRQGRGLMLIGGVGTGKTHVACAIARLACAQSDWLDLVHFVNVPELLAIVRRSYGKTSDVEELVTGRLEITDLVVLDDIAAEKSTDWAADLLYRIVNQRYENMLATIVTANVDLESLRLRIGERIVSRLYERCVVVDMSGPDYRTQTRRIK